MADEIRNSVQDIYVNIIYILIIYSIIVSKYKYFKTSKQKTK